MDFKIQIVLENHGKSVKLGKYYILKFLKRQWMSLNCLKFLETECGVSKIIHLKQRQKMVVKYLILAFKDSLILKKTETTHDYSTTTTILHDSV